MTPTRRLLVGAVTVSAAMTLAACSGSPAEAGGEEPETSSATDEMTTAESDGTVVLYAGRNLELVEPILEQFTTETGIEVDIRDGKTAQLAAQILEEGERSPADVFLAQDAGALGAVAQAGLFEQLPAETLDLVADEFRSADGEWVAVTGRARVLVYNHDLVDQADLPDSVLDLTSADWNGRVGVAPTNASFQSFVTAVRVQDGDEAAEEFLTGLAGNDPQIYEKNGHILAAVDEGAVPVGLINHYYVFERAAELGVDPSEMAAQLHFFPDGDVGGLVNVSGVGLLTDQPDGDGQALVDFLLSEAGQQYFAEETREYPMIEGVPGPDGLPALTDLQVPDVNLNDLDDLQGTVAMISEAGLS
ncbi:iron ABC transporter substrate-binding protein [Ruania alkalisoli]|uniref:Iron ABC transporter substrate-binding protein n=1 Tax=Ruania alkalisoli TaxID=2779775 RepID=A0A7M1SS51_9MICO|nr:iron ABC transporter substrate-binding protein [Ruania alkalisoli]QOR70388.1 iron ABC transporter substrate-binding protein [Ruania alkalisoli]